jgi:O-antigen/teichoic acid export membrane protein
MRSKLLKDISASSTQVILNQALGLLIFIITSRYLDKAVYGELNWSLAILTFITTLLSLRLEQLIVRKIAAGDDPSKMLSVFCGHVFFSGIIFYLTLLAGSFIFPGFFNLHSLLLLLSVSQLLSFFSLPFKQLATGKGKFGWLAVMSSVATLVRAVWLVCIVLFASFTVWQVIMAYIISSLVELLVSMYLVQKRLQVRVRRWPVKDYVMLINESIPQIGVVFLNACIARIDWILLGIFSTQLVTAEYSFAYKVFELSPIPLLVIGPVLLTRFSSWFSNRSATAFEEKQKQVSMLIRAEMILATFLPLLLNIAWSPLMDSLTQNKYGKVNETVFLLLSLCIPFQYLINLFWTAHFAQDHLKMIFRITLVTCFIIVTGDLLLIPLLNAKGAAITYLVAMVAEYILYSVNSSLINNRDKWLPLLCCTAIALASGFSVHAMQLPVMAAMLLASVIYILLLIVTRQVRKGDLLFVKQWIFPVKAKYKTI